uniref:Uncharacterized protein n=1 Tax=viral metagenome TaxID=1070528 RepID=A0A6C0DG55_9ZZZZ
MDLCQYKDALGVPDTGIHSYRLFGVAIIDVLFTVLGAALIAYFFRVSFGWTFIILFLAGTGFHRLFCVQTTIANLIGA